MENEEVYIIGNGLEGVIAFEKAADENSKGEVKINGAIISSQTITVNTDAVQSQALIGTVVFSGFNVNVQAGYVEKDDVSGADSSFLVNIVAPLPVPIQSTPEALIVSDSTITADVGYYYQTISSTVRSAQGIEANITADPAVSNNTVDITPTEFNTIYDTTNHTVTFSAERTGTVTAKMAVTTSGWINNGTSLANKTINIKTTPSVTIPLQTQLVTNLSTVTMNVGYASQQLEATVGAGAVTISKLTETPTITFGDSWTNGQLNYTIESWSATPTKKVTTTGWINNVNQITVGKITSNSVNSTINVTAPNTPGGSVDPNAIKKDIIMLGVTGTYDPLTDAGGAQIPDLNATNGTITINASGNVTANATISAAPVQADGYSQPASRLVNRSVELNILGTIPTYTDSTTITPATTPVTITAANKWMPSDLTVAAIPTYIGAKTFYPTGSNQTVNITNLYATQNLTVGKVVVTGLDSNTILSTATINIGNANNATAVASVIGNIQTYNGVTEFTPSTSIQTIQVNGKYMTSNLTVKALTAYTSDNFNDDISTAQGA